MRLEKALSVFPNPSLPPSDIPAQSAMTLRQGHRSESASLLYPSSHVLLGNGNSCLKGTLASSSFPSLHAKTLGLSTFCFTSFLFPFARVGSLFFLTVSQRKDSKVVDSGTKFLYLLKTSGRIIPHASSFAERRAHST